MKSKSNIKNFFELVPPYINAYDSDEGKFLREILGESIKGNYVYAVTGGAALSCYDRSREPSDLDLILLDDFSFVFGEIVKKRTKENKTMSVVIWENNFNDSNGNILYLDLFTPSKSFYGLIPLENYIQLADFESIRVPVVCPELLFVSKVASPLAIRQRDVEDIKRLETLNLNKEKIKKLLYIINLPTRISLEHFFVKDKAGEERESFIKQPNF